MQKYPELKVEKSKYIAASNANQTETAAKILLLEYFDDSDLSKTNMDGLKRPHPEHFKMISGYFDFYSLIFRFYNIHMKEFVLSKFNSKSVANTMNNVILNLRAKNQACLEVGVVINKK